MSGRVRQFHVAVGSAFIALGLMTVGVAYAQPAGGGSARDPLRLFEPMYPVFTSPRCANCHGGLDPIAGVNHDKIEDVPLDSGDMLPGRDGNSQCLECHDENADTSVWRLAPSQLSFVGKDPLKLCQQIRADNGLQQPDAQSISKFLNHLSGDQLIGMGFEGKRAMTENDAQPPPMDRATFVNLARRWVTEGKARCGPWNGTITVQLARSGNLKVDGTITVTVRDGEGSAEVHLSGHQHQTGQGCFTRDDTLTIDSENSVVPTDVNIQLNSELLPSGAPQIQVPVNLPPGVPAPPQFGNNNGYTLIVRLTGQIDAKDHWEQVDPPGCGRTSGDTTQPFMFASTVVNKMVDPNAPDHLNDTDVQQGPDGSSMTTTWDLTRS